MSLAGTILAGSPGDASNLAPFGVNPIDRYQQVYSASLFAGPVQISAITFFYTIPGGCGFPSCTSDFGDAPYAFYLSTTSQSVNALDTNLSNNVGSGQQLFFQGTASGTIPLGGSFTFNGTPFFYNPSAGNLLLDVVSLGPATGTFGRGAWLDVLTTGGTSGIFSRAFSVSAGLPTPDPDAAGFRFGLVTRFDTVDPVPEPGSLGLVLAGGLLLLMKRQARI